jgi:transposase
VKYREKNVKPINRKILAHLKKALKSIEEKINKIIEQNEKLKQQKALLKTIPGIGDVTALYFLLATKGFSVKVQGMPHRLCLRHFQALQ